MTKQEAISELTRAAELCPTTPLAEACRYALPCLLPVMKAMADELDFSKHMNPPEE